MLFEKGKAGFFDNLNRVSDDLDRIRRGGPGLSTREQVLNVLLNPGGVYNHDEGEKANLRMGLKK